MHVTQKRYFNNTNKVIYKKLYICKLATQNFINKTMIKL